MATNEKRWAVSLMLALTFATGMVDAVGYLGLDRVFTGNMTGNIVILGMGLAGADGLPVLGPAVALAAFMCGAFGVGHALKRRGRGWHGESTVIQALGGAVLVAGGVAAFAVDTTESLTQIILAALTAVVMGAQAAIAAKLAVAEVTTVVVTSTLTKFAAESLVGGGWAALRNRRLAAVSAIMAGAFAGAHLLRFGLAVPMIVAGLVSLIVAWCAHHLLRQNEITTASAP